MEPVNYREIFSSFYHCLWFYELREIMWHEITYFTVCCMHCATVWWLWGSGQRERDEQNPWDHRRIFSFAMTLPGTGLFSLGSCGQVSACIREDVWCPAYIAAPQIPLISSTRQYLSADRALFSARAAVIYPTVGFHGTEIHLRETVLLSLQSLLFAHST